MIRWPLALASTVVLGMPLAARSQEPVAVSVVLSAFVPDSSASTVAWTAGDELPLRWASPGPVSTEAWQQQQGYTKSRTGSGQVVVQDTLVKDVTVTALGDDAGIRSALIVFTELDSWLTGPIEQSLAAEGVALSALMCSRETEPPSFGNVLWTAQASGRQPVPLWLNWNCGHDGCGIALQSSPSPSELAGIECIGGS